MIPTRAGQSQLDLSPLRGRDESLEEFEFRQDGRFASVTDGADSEADGVGYVFFGDVCVDIYKMKFTWESGH